MHPVWSSTVYVRSIVDSSFDSSWPTISTCKRGKGDELICSGRNKVIKVNCKQTLVNYGRSTDSINIHDG